MAKPTALKIAIAGVCLAATIAAVVYQSRQHFAFRGITVGVSDLEQAKRAVLADPLATGLDCNGGFCMTKTRANGADHEYVLSSYRGKVYIVKCVMSRMDTENVLAALTAKYGRPTYDKPFGLRHWTWNIGSRQVMQLTEGLGESEVHLRDVGLDEKARLERGNTIIEAQ